MEDLIEKYLALLRAERHSPPSGTNKAETLVNTGVSAFTDSLPIVFNNVFPLAQRYKKAKLSKAKTGWYVWFEYRDPITGEFKQYVRKHGINRIKSINDRKRSAQGLIDAINRALSEGWTPFGFQVEANDLHDKTLLESIKYFLSLKKSLRPRTYECYKDAVRVFENFLVGSGLKFIFAQSFKLNHAMAFGDYLIKTGKYSGKSMNNHRNNISHFFNVLKDREIITNNPLRKIPLHPENAQKNLAYTKKEREILKKYFEENNPLLGEFCQCLYYLGVRPEELLQVRLQDVFMDERKIMIYSGQAKNRRQEPVYMSEAMIKMLESKNIEYYPQDYFLFGKKLKTGPERMIRNRVSDMHGAVIRSIKMNTDHTLYSWKHTGAVEFYNNNGKNLYTLMKHLRHHDMDSTMKYIRTLGLDYNAEIQVPAF